MVREKQTRQHQLTVCGPNIPEDPSGGRLLRARRSSGAKKRTEVRAGPWGSLKGYAWGMKHKAVRGSISHMGQVGGALQTKAALGFPSSLHLTLAPIYM